MLSEKNRLHTTSVTSETPAATFFVLFLKTIIVLNFFFPELPIYPEYTHTTQAVPCTRTSQLTMTLPASRCPRSGLGPACQACRHSSTGASTSEQWLVF